MPRQPRIAIGAAVLRGLRVWAAREGQDPCDLATQILGDALPPEIRSLAGLEPPKPAHTDSPRREPAEGRKPSIAAAAPPLEVSARKGRAWHGGPTPYEEQHPEIAARVLELWAGGSRNGGLSRDAVAKVMRSEGIQISAALIDKITVRPDQMKKALRLQSERRLSAVCQAAIDAEP